MRGKVFAMEAVTQNLKAFLQYVAVHLIEDPSKATLKVAELGPNKLRFKLILAGSDVALMIGRNGFTASAIRSLMKVAGEKVGVQVSLLIHSHEEEAQMRGA
ncbi:MAG: KH domain-containing protein [Luteolibacter sp.]